MKTNIKKEIGYIGLGKMGKNMVSRLLERGWKVAVYDNAPESVAEALQNGAVAAESIKELILKLAKPRLIWLMVPHQAVDQVLSEIIPNLSDGDAVIDGGNSPYYEAMKRAKELAARGARFLDVGVSGGPGGALNGACMMAGGDLDLYKKLDEAGFFRDTCAPDGWGYMGTRGAGHFVKMIHNGIEYGMMQAIAEGFAVMKKSDFKLNLAKIADLYNHKSVIESRLIGWLKSAFDQYGEDLEEVSGSVAHTGEGKWTVETAKKLEVPTPIIEGAFNFRVESENNPSYIGKILSSLRNKFGEHKAGKK